MIDPLQWQDQIYINPMMLWSAPKIFKPVVDTLHWHLTRCGVAHLYDYVDDFIVLAPPQSRQCQQYLNRLLGECRVLGMPIASHKTEGPATSLVFLGIEIDTCTGELRLPGSKLQRLQTLLYQWGDRRCVPTRCWSPGRPHACKVILLYSGPHISRGRGCTPIRLNAGFRGDLAWWQSFVPVWNGVSFLPSPHHLPRCQMATDASGHWVCGAWSGGKWFQVEWGSTRDGLPITVKELLPILLAGILWGHTWHSIMWSAFVTTRQLRAFAHGQVGTRALCTCSEPCVCGGGIWVLRQTAVY